MQPVNWLTLSPEFIVIPVDPEADTVVVLAGSVTEPEELASMSPVVTVY